MKKLLCLLVGLFLVSNAYALDLSRVKTWAVGEILTAADLNAEFNNILNHSISNNDVASNALIQASKLDFTVSSAIGSTTPSTGAFTTLSASGAATFNGSTTIGDATGDAFTINPSAWTLANAVTITGTWANLGTVNALTAGANLDIGNYELRAQTLQADVTTGTAPLIVASTTKVTNLNSDTLDGYNTSTTAGASKIYVSGAGNYLPAATVDTNALKTTTGEVSQTGGHGEKVLPGGSYGFYPQIKMGSVAVQGNNASMWDDRQATTSVATYESHISLGDTGSITIYAQQRYVTSSGEDYWIFLLVDKNTKDIIEAYAAPDHPAYGNTKDGDPNDLPHPFKNYDVSKHTIILLDKDTCLVLKQESEQTGKSILTLVNEEYKPTLNDEIYQPLHSGKFIDKDGKHIKQMVETIPSYIKVRGLSKLTDMEKQDKSNKQTQIKQKAEQDKVKKEQDRISAENKLKTLGLTQSEIKAIID